MTYAREKRLLLCAAAALVAWPLPFNQVLEWPALVVFLTVAGVCARRAAGGSEEWLSARALNLLGLAYLPILVIDFAASGRVQLVRPILHLALFGLAAKLASMRRERDKWQVWMGIFFLFLAAMSTSTHPSVILYLVLFLALAIVILVRFVHLHVLSSYGPRDAPADGLRAGRLVAAVVAVTVLLAAPLFALLPRIRTPFAYGPSGAGGEPGGARAGFSDEMSLDLIGRIRSNPEIAMRIRFEGTRPEPATLRLKASSYDEWMGRSWRRVRSGRELRRDPGTDLYRLSPARSQGKARIVLEPLRSRSLILPTETVAVAMERGGGLGIDDGGALLLPAAPNVPIEYEALLGASGRSHAQPPRRRAPVIASARPLAPIGPLDREGVTPRLRDLASSWAGSGGERDRIERIERRLLSEYSYTAEFVGRGGDNPIESFLFDFRQGHCEYFASAMVLLLRSQQIPARLVTGFYGAEWSPWERVWVVRQSNAHAWVEAWVPGEGWLTFDPTPPSGRPLVTPRSIAHYVRQGWEAVLFRWDRWVISYDFDDQVSVLGGLREAWDRFWSDLFRREAPGRQVTAAPSSATGAAAWSAATESRALRGWWLAALIATVAALLGSIWLLRQKRTAWSATRVYRQLRQALAAAGLAVPDSLAPLALERLAEDRLAAAGAPAGRVVRLYLREAFAGESHDADTIAELRTELKRVIRAGRRERSRQRRAAARGG